MTKEEKITIPEEVIQICRDMAKVAQQHGLSQYSGEFYPPKYWGGKVGFRWDSGRHGIESNDLTVWSNFNVTTKVSA